MDLSTQIGKLIAGYRRDNKLSQEKLAFLVDMHPDYIGKIERGERIPSIESLLKIIKALGISYDTFFKYIV